MSEVPAIFKDPLLQQKFNEQGFVKITLLSEADVAGLSALYTKYFPDPSQDFFSSSYENDFPLKKEISEAIGKLILPRLAEVFTDYTWFGSAFLSKGNGPRSEMPMHQDWTIVDETKYVALNIWTPLQLTTEENGTLEVLAGSHKWHNALRAPTLPFYYDGFQQQLKAHLMAIPTRPTEAVVLNQAVIHYSKPNRTNTIRVALTTGIKTKDAPMIFHYWNKERPNEIEQFKQDDDFLIRFTDFHQAIFKRPVIGKSAGVFPFQFRKPSPAELDAVLGTGAKEEHLEKKGIGQKLWTWFRK